MKKMLLLFVVVSVLGGCRDVVRYSAKTRDVGGFELLHNSLRTVVSGQYQSGVAVYGYGLVEISTSGGVAVDGGAYYYRDSPGEYWFPITVTADGTIETTVISGSFSNYEPPEYVTYTLNIEVQ